MTADISTRNGESQPEIFLSEIPLPINDLLKCGMGKPSKVEAREIFLGQWLGHFELGPTEAAEIAGCTQSYITNISGGRRPNINVLYLLKISEHLGISVNDFFRPLPSESSIEDFEKLSSKAQAALLGRRRKPR